MATSASALRSSHRLNELSASEIVAAIRAGKTTCEAVTRACLERIAERDAQVQAWQYVNPEQAIKEAQTRDRAGAKGSLIGVPFNVKDIIDTSDMPTEYGSPIYAGHCPRADAACVAISRRLRLLRRSDSVDRPGRGPGPWYVT